MFTVINVLLFFVYVLFFFNFVIQLYFLTEIGIHGSSSKIFSCFRRRQILS